MRLIGLTGGIATGKSTVAAMLAARGADIIDADVLAREVLLPGMPAFDDVVAHFGESVLDAHGAIDRPTLGAMVFANPALRAELEAITHPRINEAMRERILGGLRGDAPLVVADIPLLFENDREAMFDGTLLVYAPTPVQLHRLCSRDGLDEAAARQRLAAQLPIEDKLGRATWVIDNGASLDATTAQVEAWWLQINPGERPSH